MIIFIFSDPFPHSAMRGAKTADDRPQRGSTRAFPAPALNTRVSALVLGKRAAMTEAAKNKTEVTADREHGDVRRKDDYKPWRLSRTWGSSDGAKMTSPRPVRSQ